MYRQISQNFRALREQANFESDLKKYVAGPTSGCLVCMVLGSCVDTPRYEVTSEARAPAIVCSCTLLDRNEWWIRDLHASWLHLFKEF